MKKFFIIFIILGFFGLFGCKNNEISHQQTTTENFNTTEGENNTKNNLTLEKENSKKCIQKLDTNFFHDNKNEGSNATLQAFLANDKCYYIFIEKNIMPLYLVFSFDDNTGIKNPKNSAYYFFDTINIQDFDGHNYSPIQGDFIHSLDNVFRENNIIIPRISYNLKEDGQNGYFISNSIEIDIYENILEKIWNFRDLPNYQEQKNFFKTQDKEALQNLQHEISDLKACGTPCQDLYTKKYEQFTKVKKMLGE